MNNYTNSVIPIFFWFIHTWYILHPNIYVLEKLAWVIEIWMENHLVSNNNYNIVNLWYSIFLYKEWKVNVRFAQNVGDATWVVYK